MYALATRRVWFLGVMKISDQNAWRWLFVKVNSRKYLISKQPLWKSDVPDAYQSLLFAKVWYSIWCAQLAIPWISSINLPHLELPEHLEFLWGKVANEYRSELGPIQISLWAVGHADYQQHWHGPLMVPAVLCHLVLFPLWFQILFQVQGQEKKEEFISSVAFVTCHVCELWRLPPFVWHCSETPLETTRR